MPSLGIFCHKKARNFRDFGEVSIAPIGARGSLSAASEILRLFVANLTWMDSRAARRLGDLNHRGKFCASSRPAEMGKGGEHQNIPAA
jgi:hypothetical protein